MTPSTKKTLAWIGGAVLIAAAAAIGIHSYLHTPFRGEDTWIYLPQGTTREALSDTLQSRLGHATASRVARIYSLAAKDSAEIHGAYLIPHGTAAIDIARRIVNRRQTPIRLTFNNVRTLDQLAVRLADQMEFSPQQFLAACDSVLPAAGFRGIEEYPAAFLPDTYEFYWTTPAKSTVSRLLDHRNNFWTDERHAKAGKLGLTPVQVATVASIAEEETNDRTERGTVARLYLNRLDRGMKLQADPTVKFATGDFALRRILGKHLKTPSAYNTYLNPGLPPGPIRIPAAATLQSVLDAPVHDYLFMCAKDDFSGTHNFARDFATHRQNARRYQAALNARKIK